VATRFKQYKLSTFVTDEREIDITINVDNDDYVQPNPADSITLGRRYSQLLKGNISPIEDTMQDENGDPVPSRRAFTLADHLYYEGVLGDGTPFTENVAADNTTLWNTAFQDKEQDYPVFFVQRSTFIPINDVMATGTYVVVKNDLPIGLPLTLGKGTPDEETFTVTASYPLFSMGTLVSYQAILSGTVANDHYKAPIWYQELYWIGDIDPDSLPRKQSAVIMRPVSGGQTGTYQQTIELRMSEAIERLAKILVQDIVEGNQTADYPTKPAIRGQRFNGFQKSDMHTTSSASLPWYGGLAFYNYAGAVSAPRKVPNSTLGPNNLSFLCTLLSYGIHPQYATWGITPAKVLAKICEFGGITCDSSVWTTGAAVWRQLWDDSLNNGEGGFVPSLVAGQSAGLDPFTKLFLNYNYYFGLNPNFDPFSVPRRYFSSEVTLDKNQSVIKIIDDIATEYLCKIDFDYDQVNYKPRLLLRDRRALGTQIPAVFDVLAGESEIVDRPNDKRRVKMKNRGDDATMSCPTDNGDSIDLEMPWRVRKWGRHEGLYFDDLIVDSKLKSEKSYTRWNISSKDENQSNEEYVLTVDIDSSSGHTVITPTGGGNPFNSDWVGRVLVVTYEPGPSPPVQQVWAQITEVINGSEIRVDVVMPSASNKGATVSTSTINPDGWLGGAMLFCLQTDSASLAFPIASVDPFTSEGLFPSDWSGFYACSFFEYNPTATTATLPAADYSTANTIYSPLLFMADELLGHKTEMQRGRFGVGNECGLITGLKTNCYLVENGVKYRGITIGTHEFLNTTRFSLLELSSDYPAIPVKPTYRDGEFGSTTGGSIGSSGLGTGGTGSGSDTITQLDQAVILKPAAAHRNRIQAKGFGIAALETELFTGSTSDHFTSYNDDGTTIVYRVDSLGNLVAQTITGTSLSLSAKGTSAATVDADASNTLVTKGYILGKFGNVIVTNPSTNQTITPTANTVTPLTINGISGQLTDLFELRLAGILVAYVTASGDIFGSTITAGTNVIATSNVTAGNKVYANNTTVSGDPSNTCTTKNWVIPNSPNSSNPAVLQPTDNTTAGLIIRKNAANTGAAHLLSVQNSAGTVEFIYVDAAGQVIVNTSIQQTVSATGWQLDCTASAASGTNIILFTNSGTSGRGQLKLTTKGTFTTGPLTNQSVLDSGTGFSGSISTDTRIVSGATTLDGTYSIVGGNTSAASFTITLPAASTCKGHRWTVYKTVAANTLTVGTAGGNINGLATKAWTAQWSSFTFYSNGTDYVIE
jgi:hypothetical protein